MSSTDISALCSEMVGVTSRDMCPRCGHIVEAHVHTERGSKDGICLLCHIDRLAERVEELEQVVTSPSPATPTDQDDPTAEEPTP